MAKKPLFSIVIPTRDRPELVVKVLKSLLLQTFSDFEVIISDNGSIALCEHQISSFLEDARFHYKRPPSVMNMCDHWEFAIESAQGEYITVLGDKFILRSDALSLMAKEISKFTPDVVTWQYEFFDVNKSVKGELYGDYHPLIRPGVAKLYPPSLELERRFSFDFPLFCRINKSSDNYGKIYSGFVRMGILKYIKNSYGRIFPPMSPDFTSMIAILNESKICVDINQALMLIISMDGISTGAATRTSLYELRKFVESYGVNTDDYWQKLPIKGFGVGHNSIISAEFDLIKSLAVDGPIKSLKLDRGAIAFWAKEDLKVVSDINFTERTKFEKLLLPWIDSIDKTRRERLEYNLMEHSKPSKSEIYHSGLKKTNEFIRGISAEHLAYIHWHDGIALPRKPVSEKAMELFEALDYLEDYNNYSCQILGINTQ